MLRSTKRGKCARYVIMQCLNAVHVLLNYGHAVLESQIRKYINVVGLDPAVGYLHELAQSKTPLVYDLQELYPLPAKVFPGLFTVWR